GRRGVGWGGGGGGRGSGGVAREHAGPGGTAHVVVLVRRGRATHHAARHGNESKLAHRGARNRQPRVGHEEVAAAVDGQGAGPSQPGEGGFEGSVRRKLAYRGADAGGHEEVATTLGAQD